jgi:hypothetical protein
MNRSSSLDRDINCCAEPHIEVGATIDSSW